MMQLGTMDLEREFGLPRTKWIAHELKDFFAQRKIQNKKIAKCLEVSSVLIGYWLNGNIPVPERRENELQTLANKIREWERKEGRMFNNYKPQRTAIKR
jgi:hypothetical protein